MIGMGISQCGILSTAADDKPTLSVPSPPPLCTRFRQFQPGSWKKVLPVSNTDLCNDFSFPVSYTDTFYSYFSNIFLGI